MVRFGFRIDKIYFWPVRLYFKQNYRVQVEYNPILPDPCRTLSRIFAFCWVGEASPLAHYDSLLANRPSQLLTSGNSERKKAAAKVEGTEIERKIGFSIYKQKFIQRFQNLEEDKV